MTQVSWTLTDEAARRPVFVGSDISDAIQTGLEARGIATTREAAGAVVAFTAKSREIPTSARWVHCPYMGVDALARWISPEVAVLTRTIDGMPERMASYVATMVWAERWQLHRFELQQATVQWKQYFNLALETDRCVIIAGTGKVGGATATTLRPYFPTVVGVSRSGRPVAGFDQVCPLVRVDAAPTDPSTPDPDITNHIDWGAADTVVLTLPLTEQTRGIISESILTSLDDAHLIAIGRGATLDFDALERAIAAGHVRHATIDVFPREPLAPDSWMWHNPHVTITPHICGLTRPDDAITSFLDARRALMTGETPAGLVVRERGY